MRVTVLFRRPGALARLGVALDKAPQGIDELAGEFVPVRHASLLAGPACLPGRAVAMTF
jgi:hypothetical protein